MEEEYFGREALKMIYLYILCEGQTEESFINNILVPYFENINIYVTPIILETKRTGLKKYKGGVSDYDKIKKEVQTLACNKNSYVTTMFDYYAMPANTPNINYKEVDIYKRIDIIENAINQDIGVDNCFFNLMLHEFEGLLFSSPTSFEAIGNSKLIREVQSIRNSYPTPEHINNSPDTAPSKRLESLIANYSKVINGTILSKTMGLDIMMRECLHFNQWINKIKSLKG